MDGSLPGSPIPGILQARTPEWVAISFSNAWKWKVKGKSLSHVRLSVSPWTAAYQAPPSMGFSRQEYWSGVSLPSLWFSWLNEVKMCNVPSGAPGTKMPSKKFTAVSINSTAWINPPKVSNGRFCQAELCSCENLQNRILYHYELSYLGSLYGKFWLRIV